MARPAGVVRMRGTPALTGAVIDPVALLKREHELILNQLAMIEAMIPARPAKDPRMTSLTMPTLRELLRFLTTRVGIHFKREAVLITALTRRRTVKREGTPFRTLLREHQTMTAETAGLIKSLPRARPLRGPRPIPGPEFESVATQAAALIRRYRCHLQCEERILFVLADMRLSATEKRRVARGMLEV